MVRVFASEARQGELAAGRLAAGKLAAALLALALGGCWTAKGSVSYAKFNAFPQLEQQATQVVGEVTGEGSVHYAGVCDIALESALEDALQSARNQGANALTKVRWLDGDGKAMTRPVCDAGFAIYWWGGFAEVAATAVRVPDAQLARLKKGIVPVADAGSSDRAGDTPEAPASSRDGSKDWAVIVGIESYQGDLPAASHAVADADAFAAYAERTLGVPSAHIKVLKGQRAGKAAIESAIKEWLPRNVRAKGARVYVFFSGHGAPDPETGEAYLVPWDADPAYLKTRGVSIKGLYGALETLPSREVYVFLDACFSGSGTRSVLAKGTRPLVPVKATQAKRLIAFTAAGARETTGAARDQPHGLFTRYLLAGLGGAADANGDGAVGVSELAAFVQEKVSADARLDNREQTPQLVGPKAGHGRALVEGLQR